MVFKLSNQLKRLSQHLANTYFQRGVFCNNQTLAKVHYSLFCEINLDEAHQEVVWVIYARLSGYRGCKLICVNP